MEAISDWKLKDWLEAGAYAAAILAAIAGAIVFLGGLRSNAIQENRAALARAWTNEGDVTSSETRFVDLILESLDGEVIGVLNSHRLDQPLDVSADVGWFYTTLTLMELRGGAPVPVAKVKVKVGGNSNRLSWRAATTRFPDYLPSSTELWPYSVPRE